MGWRARSHLGDINQLASSINREGQLQPIVVSNGAGIDYELIAGNRRLAACKQLQRDVLAVVVEPNEELTRLDMQLLENMSRKDFDKLEVGVCLLRRKALYEAEHPETKHGAAGGGRNGKGARTKTGVSPDKTPVPRFTLATAQMIGRSEVFVHECLQLAQLPERKLKPVRDAKTTSERSRAATDAIRGMRVERKREKLKARAAVAAEKLDNIPTEEQGKVCLVMKDNRDYFAEAEAGTIDLILTDPPYESGRQALVQHTSRGDISGNFGAWDKLDVGWVLKAAPLLIEGGQALIFSPLEAIGDYRIVCEAAGLTWRGALIWKKSNPGTVHRPVYLSSVEAICWATRGDKYHFNPFENAGAPEVHNHIEGPICGGNERLDHPTQKPEWLINRLINRHCHPGSYILDPFAGVGTTLVCAKRRGLRADGVEIDPDYCGQAVQRLRAEAKSD